MIVDLGYYLSAAIALTIVLIGVFFLLRHMQLLKDLV